MAKILNTELFERMVSEGFISQRKHPLFDLYILNYTKECQYSRTWNDVTTVCRGLMVDAEGNIVSRPYKKFFNFEEIEDKTEIPNGKFDIYEKIDGTLGISYIDPNGNVGIATRGSFDSDQAVWASKWIKGNPFETVIKDNPNYTFLFEIVIPWDKKIVNYHGEEALVLTGVIKTEDASELPIENFANMGVDIAKKYEGITDWTKVREIYNGDNREGFVVKFANNYRVKMKYESWFRLNLIKSGLSVKRILETIINGDELSVLKVIGELDEEDIIYYKKIFKDVYALYNEIMIDSMIEYRDFDTDKEAAEYFLKCKYPAVMFNIRKGKNPSTVIWKIVKRNFKVETHTYED